MHACRPAGATSSRNVTETQPFAVQAADLRGTNTRLQHAPIQRFEILDGLLVIHYADVYYYSFLSLIIGGHGLVACVGSLVLIK